MIYVALLRAINVGGKNKVEMRTLKKTFESLGFKNVVTYINSGNIIFEAISEQQGSMEDKIENAIKRDFHLDLKVLIRDIKAMESIHEKLPLTWVKDKTMRTDVMFLWEKIDTPRVAEQLMINDVDKVKYVSGAILWNIEDENYSKSAMPKLIGTELYKHMTIRNANTFRKIYQIMTEIQNGK